MTKQSCGALLLVLFLLGLAPQVAAGRGGPPIKIHGNWVIVDEVYRAIIDLPAGAKADKASARQVRKQLQQFLHRAGYSLATVKAQVVDGVIEVELDEGSLEKIVFLGCGTFRALQLKLNINLPHHVFNRPYLVRQLKWLSKRYDIKQVTYRLVTTERVKHRGPQIDEIGGIGGQSLFPKKARYELHIMVDADDWNTGFGLDLDYDFPDGATLGASFQERSLLFNDDRWRVGAKVGAKIREKLESGDPYMALSRAAVEAKYFTPSLWGTGLRPFLWLKSDLVSRQRPDLDTEMYYSEDLEGSLNIGYEFTRGMLVSVGGGVSQRWVFEIDQIDSPSVVIADSSRLRPFAVAKADLVLDIKDLRRDRRHRLILEGRHYWVEGEKSLAFSSLKYRKVFGFGWHDLWLKVRGTIVWGDVLFDDEEPVGGRYIRGVFGNKYYVHKVGSLTLEFRLSLARDLFKVSVFHDLAVFGELDRVNDDETFRLADSFGLGFHALILDLFQFDIYYCFGFSSDDDFSHGISASIKKVF
jgi:hypothetical protein